MKRYLEICTGSIDSCICAQKGGADRVELCANLSEGGTTPSYATIELAKERLKLEVMVMLRPRGGDFYYNDTEFELIRRDLLVCKKIGVKGVVFGILTKEGEVDKERCRELVEMAGSMEVCFHRAIDMTRDYYGAVKDVIDCGCKRILTSGQRNKALEGAENIALIEREFGEKIEIMAGSGINSDNVAEIVRMTGVNNVHLSAKRVYDGEMVFRHPSVSMGGGDEKNEYSFERTDAEEVARVRRILNKG